MSQPDPPKTPNPAKSYDQEIQIYLQHLPELLAAEQNARTTYDPQRIAEQQSLQSQFGPTQYQQQLDALHQLDPAGSIIRDQLGASVSGDLASGYNLPPELATQLESQIRGAQAARGNVLGPASGSAEALFKGQNAINLYQQHLDNAGQFLGLQTPEAAISQITPVQADQSSAYTNPQAGFLGQQYGLANYGNQLGAYNAQAAQGNPWARGIQGAASGAAAGSAAGGWGTAIGAIAGGVGGYFSDSRLKENIHEIAKLANGLPLVRFNFRGTAKKAIGVLAQHVVRLFPEAIGFGVLNGRMYATVNYDMIGAPILELNHA